MEFSAILRGLSFRPIDAKAYAGTLTEGDPLLIEREPENAFDPNAIKVLSPERSLHIGYVAKEVAVELAPLMDEGRFFVCSVESVMMKQIILFIKEVADKPAAALTNDEVSE